VDTDLKGVIYNLVAENSGAREWEIFKDRYIKEESQQEKERLASALSSFRDPKLLQKTLEFAMGKHVRFQDAWIFIVRVWMSPEGRDLAWEYVKKNWDKLYAIYSGGHYLSRLIQTAEGFTTKERAEDVKGFFKGKDILDAKRALAQALEQIYINEAFLERDREKVKQFLYNS
jgi:puromycin-sensitive aminopeptidase